ncbi:MAG: ferrochelatase [Bryobacteraceae bacterium]
MTFDALLLVSFGGPEGHDDVMPFLENVTRGRNIPRERLQEVAGHYRQFGGRSPINDQNRALVAALEQLFAREGPHMPVYWGNRNWHPMLADTVRRMRDDGVRSAAAFVTSAFGSYSGCRQYRGDIAQAWEAAGSGAPEICKLPTFHDRPGFVEPMIELVQQAVAQYDRPHIAFTAHSVPLTMTEASPYLAQLTETSARIALAVGGDDWNLVFQSRSGPPTQPWLEPDILDHIRDQHAQGKRELVVVPIGFISDHMEVLYDLDTEAAELCRALGMKMRRVATVGTHPSFIRMIRDLLLDGCRECAPDCCPAPQRPVSLPGG